MNKLLSASFFTPSQTGTLIAIAVAGIVLIALNIALFIIFHKRGERKLYDRLLQRQREILMRQLNEMRVQGNAGLADTQPFFTNTVYVQVPVETKEAVENTAVVAAEAQAEDVEVQEPIKATVERPAERPAEEPTEQPAEEPVVVDTEIKEEQDEDEVVAEVDDDDAEEVTIINGRKIRYIRSFKARIIQGSVELQERYTELKNYILSYKGVKNRISWKHETFTVGRNSFASFVVRGKTLRICLATDPNAYNDTKYKVEDATIRSPKTKFPCLYRINNPRRVKYAKELIDVITAGLGLVKLENFAEIDYRMPYQSTEELIEAGLVKVKGEAIEVEAIEEDIAETVKDSASAPNYEVVNEDIKEEFIEDTKAAEESAEVVEEEAVAEIEEAPAEEVAAEVVDEIEAPTEAVEDVVLPERDFEILAEVDVNETDAISDVEAEQFVEVKVVKKQKVNRKNKGIVNIDFLSKNYEAGERVTIDSLHEKGLVAKEIKSIKVLARGVINKPLIVEADDFSIEAVKMIVLTGGRAIRKEFN